MGGQPLRLDEDLVLGLVGEAHHLVLDGRAVAGTHAVDGPGVHGRTGQPSANDVVGGLPGVGDVARHLGGVLVATAQEGEYRYRRVTGLHVELGVVDRAPVDAGWRAGLESAHAKRQLPQARSQRVGWRIASPAARVVALADVDPAAQKGPYGQHYGGRMEF